MGVADIIILAVVALAAFGCIRYLVRASRNGGACATCGSASACSVADRAAGRCRAAEDMLSRMEQAADELGDAKGPADV
jgi:hypothetical protein